jgi:HPt (histidine-containing phosphotransfer) domain-containing protein
MIENPTDATTPVFDRASLLERVDGDDALLCVIVEVFLEDFPNSIRAIEEALASQDATRLQGAAHSLKGASANISAEQLREAAHCLEQMGAEGQLEDAAEGVARVNQAATALKPVLERILQNGGAEC